MELVPPGSPILTVGCGAGFLEVGLIARGHDVLATDITNKLVTKVPWRKLDIFAPDLNRARETVICSQVLEHLRDWRLALKNLIALTKRRLIITVPWSHSFYDPSHVNFWEDQHLDDWRAAVRPHAMQVGKIITKEEDKELGQRAYLIVISRAA